MKGERKDLEFILDILYAGYELTEDKWYLSMAKRVSRKIREKYVGHKEHYTN